MGDTHGPGRDGVVEVEFTLSNGEYPFVGVSGAEGCRFELETMLPRPEERYAEFFRVEDVDPERVADRPKPDSVEAVETLSSHDDGGLLEFVVNDSCPAGTLAKQGAIPRTVVGDDGTGRLVAEVPQCYDATSIVASFLDEHPSASLVTKCEREYATPILSENSFERALAERLTERQLAVLKTAFEEGYYERPRETTGEELAAQLDINAATLTQHIRTAERNLLSILYETERM
jgi:hypothetical protein